MWRLVCAFLNNIPMAEERVSSTLSFMARMKHSTVAAWIYLSGAMLGCGVQTGDGNLPACVLTTDVLADLDATRADLGGSPRRMLAPLSEGIEGTLIRPSRSRAPLRFEVTLDESSASISSRDETSPTNAICGSSIALDGSLHAEGGEVFSGTGPVHIGAGGESVSLEFESTDFMTTLHPPGNPCATPGLVMVLTLGDDCTWTGDWSATTPLSADTGQGCELDFLEPLGTFSAAGNCR
jgi:hypothetical protein